MNKEYKDNPQGSSKNKWEEMQKKHPLPDAKVQGDVSYDGENPVEAAVDDSHASPSSLSMPESLTREQLQEKFVELVKQLSEQREKRRLAEIAKEEALRICADLQNKIRREAKESAKLVKFSNEKLCTSLMPGMDALKSTVQNAEENKLSDSRDAMMKIVDNLAATHGAEWRAALDQVAEKIAYILDLSKEASKGICLTSDLFQETWSEYGLKEIAPKRGDAFDPRLHAALSLQKEPGMLPDTIVTVMQTGYQLHERVLRPARVVVSAS